MIGNAVLLAVTLFMACFLLMDRPSNFFVLRSTFYDYGWPRLICVLLFVICSGVLSAGQALLFEATAETCLCGQTLRIGGRSLAEIRERQRICYGRS